MHKKSVKSWRTNNHHDFFIKSLHTSDILLSILLDTYIRLIMIIIDHDKTNRKETLFVIFLDNGSNE